MKQFWRYAIDTGNHGLCQFAPGQAHALVDRMNLGPDPVQELRRLFRDHVDIMAETLACRLDPRNERDT